MSSRNRKGNKKSEKSVVINQRILELAPSLTLEETICACADQGYSGGEISLSEALAVLRRALSSDNLLVLISCYALVSQVRENIAVLNPTKWMKKEYPELVLEGRDDVADNMNTKAMRLVGMLLLACGPNTPAAKRAASKVANPLVARSAEEFGNSPDPESAEGIALGVWQKAQSESSKAALQRMKSDTLLMQVAEEILLAIPLLAENFSRVKSGGKRSDLIDVQTVLTISAQGAKALPLKASSSEPPKAQESASGAGSGEVILAPQSGRAGRLAPQ